MMDPGFRRDDEMGAKAAGRGCVSMYQENVGSERILALDRDDR